MVNLKANGIALRALEPEDLDFMYLLENTVELWSVSDTLVPYSKHLLKKYIETGHQSLFERGQLRLVVANSQPEPLGFVDLFDYHAVNARAGIGIVIFKKENRNKGFATTALKLVMDYAFNQLNLHQLFAHIGENNSGSRHLFKKMGFTESGLLRDWSFANGKFFNEVLVQKINSNVS